MAHHADIHIHHMSRVEGHGDIHARIREGAIEEIKFSVVEAPRFFEVFLKGKHYAEAVHIVSRICGVCAVSHRLAGLKAAENAFGVKVSRQTERLRRLALNGEILCSHILHLYFLCTPDYLGVSSVFPLAESDPETLKRAIRLKRLGYEICAVTAGRHTHPTGMETGGFSFVHSEKALQDLKKQLEDAIEDIEAAVEFFRLVTLPSFERETEYVSLKNQDRYAFYDGRLYSSDDVSALSIQYRDLIKEYTVSHSNARHARWRRPEYMTGALARLNNNQEQISLLGRGAMSALNLNTPLHNPFLNIYAQIVECAHCVQSSIELIDKILDNGIRKSDELTVFQPRKGRGVGAIEAPRGLLLHDFEYDGDGICTDVNLVIPTAQNMANLEADMREYATEIIDQSESEIARRLQMLARAYDPCISCSVH